MSDVMAQPPSPNHEGPSTPNHPRNVFSRPRSCSMRRQIRAFATMGVTTGTKKRIWKNGAQVGSDRSHTAMPVQMMRLAIV